MTANPKSISTFYVYMFAGLHSSLTNDIYANVISEGRSVLLIDGLSYRRPFSVMNFSILLVNEAVYLDLWPCITV